MNIREKIFNIDWRTKAFVWLLVVGALLSITLFSTLVAGFNLIGRGTRAEEAPRLIAAEEVRIEAKSALVWDIMNERALYEKNSDIALPLASLTKVMTVVTAAELAPNLEDVTINLTDLMQEGDSKLKVQSSWSKKNLIDYILLVSSNDGAHALAASVGALNYDFVSEMNKIAAKIGLSKSIFFNEHGLDDHSTNGAYGSARDVTRLFEYVLKNHPHLLEATRYKDLSLPDLANHIYLAENTNEVIDLIPSPIASKTGYTDLAGGNLVVAFDAGLARPIIITVLGSSEQGRFSDMLALVEASMKYISEN